MKKIVCIDLGWTIEDETLSQLDRIEQICGICKKYDRSINEIDFLKAQQNAGTKGISSTYTYALEHCGLTDEIIADITKNVHWNTKYLRLYPGVQETLKRLSCNYELVLLANQSKPVNQRLIEYQINDYFKYIICSCEVNHEKPDLEIFRLVNKYYQNETVEYWMIGDRIDNDIKPAKELGWKTIRIIQGDHKNYMPVGKNEIADYTINDFTEISSIIIK